MHGTLRDSSGAVVVGADMEWDSWVGAPENKWYWGEGITGTGGAFSMTAVPTTNGEVWAYPDADSTLARGVRTWVDGGSYDESLYPGRVSVTATRGGRWHDFTKLVVRLSGADRFSKGAVIASDTTSTPVSGLIDVLDGAYSVGSAKFFWDEGVEFSGSIGVTSGATSGTSISVDEATAQRVWMQSPSWYSGKPGTTVRLMLENFPAGWINRVTGYSDDPAAAAAKVLGTWTSRGAAATVTQRQSAGDGQAGLRLLDRLPARRRRGQRAAALRGRDLSGVHAEGVQDPGQGGHEDPRDRCHPDAGPLGQPGRHRQDRDALCPQGQGARADLVERRQGWTKVGSVKANGFGAYKTPYFKPLTTLTLVVRYPGDDWYHDAYTSTQKISVR